MSSIQIQDDYKSVPLQQNDKIQSFVPSQISQQQEQSQYQQDQFYISNKKNKKQSKYKKYKLNTLNWTVQDQKQLINLHKNIGNKWTLLSKYFPGRLRKSIRKLNKCISNIFMKKYNKFNLNIIFKLSNISEGKIMGKCNIEQQISYYYKEFIYQIIQFSQNQNISYKDHSKNQLYYQIENFILSLIALENLFRIISGQRVYKGKKKNIAYLKRFNFKLDSKTNKTLVITKERCYISQEYIQTENQLQKSNESLELPQSCISQSIKDIQKQMTFQQNKILENKEIQMIQGQIIYLSNPQKLIKKNQISSNTDQYQIQSSLSSYTIFDSQLRQFQMPMSFQKYDTSQNIFDIYSENRGLDFCI